MIMLKWNKKKCFEILFIRITGLQMKNTEIILHEILIQRIDMSKISAYEQKCPSSGKGIRNQAH